MTMSVVASTLSTVGMRKSDFGLLELMWYPGATRNESGTVAGLPCTAVMSGAGAIFTAGGRRARGAPAPNPHEGRGRRGPAGDFLLLSPPAGVGIYKKPC